MLVTANIITIIQLIKRDIIAIIKLIAIGNFLIKTNIFLKKGIKLKIFLKKELIKTAIINTIPINQ
ncbi:MAG: hypothetical protein KAH84_11685 [Thiomargarita sp.]|nr:hypothetical protein [Thiomargarita sp.]